MRVFNKEYKVKVLSYKKARRKMRADTLKTKRKYGGVKMEIVKWILRLYFTALICLLMIFGVILVFRPDRALEIIGLLKDQTSLGRLYILLVMNLLWSVGFIVFDLWNIVRTSEGSI